MMNQINRILNKIREGDLHSDSGSRTGESDLPVDHQLTFNRDANERWTYKDGQILVNNEDIEELVKEERDNVRFQVGVSEALSEYKAQLSKRKCRDFGKFCSKADTIQGTILSNMRRIFDEKTSGVRMNLNDGNCLLNNVNIRAFIAMYKIHPTLKAYKFLRNLKSKLALILVNKGGSAHFDRLTKIARDLYDEVEGALQQTPIDGAFLTAGSGHHIA